MIVQTLAEIKADLNAHATTVNQNMSQHGYITLLYTWMVDLTVSSKSVNRTSLRLMWNNECTRLPTVQAPRTRMSTNPLACHQAPPSRSKTWPITHIRQPFPCNWNNRPNGHATTHTLHVPPPTQRTPPHMTTHGVCPPHDTHGVRSPT